ncbi:hypothetical protein [Mycobacterium sp. 1423905.2]|uniref:hypothetical protein n=1 Tax=Mycobacterium sp. 1423905.2 TaxID=1856859 RepID=UPI0008007C5E|nr:hypothetical protein [Mycobacterium sp. 1423905.2]OBJ48867.1 hypothetical protein A9W95_03435 [Mycobacterium sp. 1423905.2]
MSPTTGNGIPGALVDLDWHTVSCQSEAGCSNRATHIVHLHAVDSCDHPNLDPFGNTVEILCIACLWQAAAEALAQVGRLRGAEAVHCLTCGAPVSELSDIMRDAAAL